MDTTDWTAAEWGGFLTAAGAAVVLLVKTCFSGLSESRCEEIKCCGCYITRKVKSITNTQSAAPPPDEEPNNEP
tara:strand:- start:693 stop:914 length:222 start_codon:yes stop_codon:yes gene_type:complete